MKLRFKNNASITFFVLAFLLLTFGRIFAATQLQQTTSRKSIGSAPELNPDYVEWLAQQKQEATQTNSSAVTDDSDENYLGDIPEPYGIGYQLIQSRSKRPALLRLQSNSLPEKYDLRDVDGKCYVTCKVSNQNPLGTCWTFASMEPVQSNMLLQGFADNESSDMSKWVLAYGAYNNESSEKQCYFRRKKMKQKPYPYYSGGGNADKATALMTRGSALVLESTAPYPYENRMIKQGQPVPPTSFTPVRTLKESHIIAYNINDLETSKNDVKNALMKYGAMYVSIKWRTSSFNKSSSAYYNNNGELKKGGHAVTIVGWDDSYSKDNFKSGMQPSEDGAWIVKNSWGEKWGDHGYFYLSYEDKTIRPAVVAFETEAADSSEKIYQYDMFGYVSDRGDDSVEADFANIFEAASDGSIKAVGFWTTDSAAYTVKIYTNCNSGDPESGTLVHTQTGSADPGYHRIALSTPVSIAKGSKFSVVVSVKNKTNEKPVPLCLNEKNYVDKATSQPGRSFLRFPEESWTDATEVDESASVCIKAFVSQADTKLNLKLYMQGRSLGQSNIEDIELYLYDESNNEFWNGSAGTNVNGIATFEIPQSVLSGRNTVQLWVKGKHQLAKLFSTETSGITGQTWDIAPQSELLAGDANGDNKVNSSDLKLYEDGDMSADFNGDGVVNSADLDLLNANFGQEGAAKPQPSQPSGSGGGGCNVGFGALALLLIIALPAVKKYGKKAA